MAEQTTPRPTTMALRWAITLSTITKILAKARKTGFGFHRPGQPRRLSTSSVVNCARSAAALLVLTALLSVSVQVQAITLVSNHAQGAPAGTQIVNALEFAQGFTTGSSPGGYLLNRIYIHFDRIPGIPSNFVATLWSADGTGATPATPLFVLGDPDDLPRDGLWKFAAPSGTVLQPGTTYFVHLSYNWTGNEQAPVLETATGQQAESEALKGWSAAGNWLSRPRGTSESWNSYPEAIRITVEGSVVTPPMPGAANGSDTWRVTVTPATISESAPYPAILTVGTGTAFAEDQTIVLVLAGTAELGNDFTVESAGTVLSAPYRLTLPAGDTSVTAAFNAVADTVVDSGETIRITAVHEGVQIGERRTVTITDTTFSLAALARRPLVIAGGAAALAAGVTVLAGGGGGSPPTAVAREDGEPADEVGEVVLRVLPRQVAEGAGATTVTVTASLTSGTRAVATEVTVRIGGGTAINGRDYRPVPRLAVRIPAGERRGRETFTLTPVQDETAERSETVQVRGTATGLTVKAATLTITDDDEPAVSVAPTELTLTEGASGTYTVGLNSQPQREVTVTVKGATEDVLVSPMELTFTASNWDQGRTVTVTAMNDSVAEDQERVELTHTVIGYGSIATADGVTVTVIDPDVPSTRIDLSLRPIRIWEGAKETSVTVRAALDAGPRDEDTTVRLSVADGTATRGMDYEAVRTLLLKIPAGAIKGKATFKLTPQDDSLDEHNETIYVTGTVARSIQLQVNGDTLWLIDNDAAPAPSNRAASGSAGTTPVLTIRPGRAVEGSGQVEFRVQPTPPSPVPVTVSYETKDGTAKEGEDYTRKSGMLRFAPDMTEQKIVVEINDDLLDEGNEETFTMTLKDARNAVLPQGASEQQTTGTIEDDDSSSTGIDLSLNPTSVSEDAGATTVTVTATLNGGVQTSDTRVTVSVAGDTATAGTDFKTINDVTLTILAGNLNGEATFSFEPLQDTTTEGAETVAVSGTVTRGATLPVTAATLTLRDDDTMSRRIDLSLNPSSVSESAGATSVTVKATLDAMARTEETQVTMSVGGGTAESGTDYASVPAVTVTIPANQLSGTADFTLTPTQDEIAEGPETLQVGGRVTAGTTLPVTAATLTLTDDDTASTSIALTLNPDSVSEGEAATPVTVTATLNDAALTEDTKVTVSVGGGTAESGTDYASVSAVTVTIPAGARTGSADFTLTPTQDEIAEGPETLEVSGTAGNLTVTRATLTITDDDTASTSIALSLDPVGVSEDAGATPVTVTATLNASARTEDTEVTVSVGGGTAESGVDYTPIAAVTVTIGAGAKTGMASITLTPTQDEIDEPSETLAFGGTVATTGTDLGVTEATFTITDDDMPSTGIALSLNPDSVSEGAAATTVTVTATLDDGARTEETQITVSVDDDTAVAGTDFESIDDVTLAIAAGAKTGTVDVTLTPVQDDIFEGPETLEVSGTVTAGATLPVTAATLTLTDDDTASTSVALSLDPDSVFEAEADPVRITVTAALNEGTRSADTQVTVSVAGDTAAAGTDFAEVEDVTLTIPAEMVSGTAVFLLEPLQDDIVEDAETLEVSGLAVGLTVTPATLTLTDDDTASTSIALSLSPNRVSEAAGDTPVAVKATLNEGARASDTQVTVSVSGGSATAGTDYAEIDDLTVTIQAGALSGEEVFVLRPTRDELIEPAETLEFSGMADLTVTAATLTLADAGETSWSVSADPDLINEDGGGSTLTVSTNDRTFADDQVIALYLTGSTATPGVDFRLADEDGTTLTSPYLLTMEAGATSVTATITALDDELTEAGEGIVISALHNHAAIGTEWVTIADDETTTRAFGIEPKACNERPVPEQVQINGRKVTIVFSQELGTGTQDPNDVPYPPYFHFEIHTDSNPNPPDPNPQEPRFVKDDTVVPDLDHYAVAYSREGRRVELTTEAPVTAGETVWVVYHRFGVYAPLFDVGNENGVCTFITRAENLTAGFIMVANADAVESDGTMDFEVTLAPVVSQASGTVTVEYDTVDGTAMAGEDYVGTSGRLSFEPGESSHTVSVTLIDDSLDDGGETFTLTLRNASTEKGYWITDGEAVGTIYNTDPLPKAWTARFGRAVASHVVDALEARLDASRSYAQIGGHRLGGVADVSRMGWRLVPDRQLWQDGAAEAAGQGMTTQQWLLGSSFHLVSNDGQGATGPRMTAWGRVAASGFDGKEGGTSLDGMVTTATLGVDGNWERWLAGVALAYSEGDGSFGQDQDVGSTLTSLHPYVAYAVSDRVRLWAMVGYGDGEFRLSGAQSLSTGLEMTMGAVGVRGEILQPSQPENGLQLALRSDVMWVGMDTAATAGMAATEAEVTRLRLALEGSRAIPLDHGGSLVPSLEIGLRQDGGDAETGSGMEMGGGVLYAAAWGLSIEASVRGLLAHEASDYQEWGASGALRFAHGKNGRGLMASIVPAWGSSASGISRLWAQADASRLAVDNALATVAAGRLDAELGYGLAAPWGRGLLTPYARVALVEGAEQAWHLGTRLALVESLDLSLQAGRRQREGHAAAHELALRAYLGW